MFPRLALHTCALTGTISLSYHGVCAISLSPVLLKLNSDFPCTFLNGQFTRHTIIIELAQYVYFANPVLQL